MKRIGFKLLLSILPLLSFATLPAKSGGMRIDFQVSIHNPTGVRNPVKRSPMRPLRPIEASLDGHTLSIGEHPDLLLRLLNSDETVVFETYLPSSVYEVQLPENITGDFELQLQTDNVTFIGEIEL